MFDLEELKAAIARHGRVARVVIAGFEGSSPREAGAAMLVWATGQSGTIGGGALEHQASLAARQALLAASDAPEAGQGKDQDQGAADQGAADPGPPRPPSSGPFPRALPRAQVSRIPLGPALGQCCGGAVTLVTEVYAAAPLPQGQVIARSLDGSAAALAVKRILARARSQGEPAATQLVQGWLIEPLARPTRHLWVWGAGHVGRAIVAVMAPLPDLAITWVDVAPERFPNPLPPGVTALPAPDPAAAVALAPRGAEHLILTFSHTLDLELCHRLLGHGYARCGLIGSATKWARFRGRLAALGHDPARIATLTCPIGDPALGKHPQAIALGVASAFLRQAPGQDQGRDQGQNPGAAPGQDVSQGLGQGRPKGRRQGLGQDLG